MHSNCNYVRQTYHHHPRLHVVHRTSWLSSSCPASHTAVLLHAAVALLLMLAAHLYVFPLVVVTGCHHGVPDTRRVVSTPDQRRRTRTNVCEPGPVTLDEGVIVQGIGMIKLSLLQRLVGAWVLQLCACVHDRLLCNTCVDRLFQFPTAFL